MTKLEITPKAPVESAYVTIGTDGVLTSERNLTGTSNQITVTDNGAGSTVVLSTPQDIHTDASVQFDAIGVNRAPSSTAGSIYATTGIFSGAGIITTTVAGQFIARASDAT